MNKERSRPFTLVVLLAAGWLGLRAFIPDLSPVQSKAEGQVIASGREVPAVPGDMPFAVASPMVSIPDRSSGKGAAAGKREVPIPLLRLPSPALGTMIAPPLIVRDTLPEQAGPPHANPAVPEAGLASNQTLPGPTPANRQDRFALSAWLLARDGNGAPALSGRAALGGSQAGVRASWRLDRLRRCEAFARVSSTGRPGDGAEAAAGVAFRPHRRLPIQLVAERRQAIAGEGGRSAFAAYAVGGVDSAPVGPVHIDAYGAAGLVGLRSRDLFAEGSAVGRIPLARLGPVDISAGGGVWAAVQPGASRVDVGPRAQLRWRDGPVRPVISLDWRQRVAGDARPQSGPALTVGVDF